MKRYVSLASAMMIGTVVSHEKKSIVSSNLMPSYSAKAVRAAQAAHYNLQAKKPVYASDVSDLDHEEVAVEKKDPAKSEKTSARSVQVEKKKPTKKEEEDPAKSSATSHSKGSADVADKEVSIDYDEFYSPADVEKDNSASSASSDKVAMDYEEFESPADVEKDNSASSTPEDVEADSSADSSKDNEKKADDAKTSVSSDKKEVASVYVESDGSHDDSADVSASPNYTIENEYQVQETYDDVEEWPYSNAVEEWPYSNGPDYDVEASVEYSWPYPNGTVDDVEASVEYTWPYPNGTVDDVESFYVTPQDDFKEVEEAEDYFDEEVMAEDSYYTAPDQDNDNDIINDVEEVTDEDIAMILGF
jgi:hypothetical protein